MSLPLRGNSTGVSVAGPAAESSASRGWEQPSDPSRYPPLSPYWPHRSTYDTGRLELLPYLEPRWRAEIAHAVLHMGLIGAYRRLGRLSH